MSLEQGIGSVGRPGESEPVSKIKRTIESVAGFSSGEPNGRAAFDRPAIGLVTSGGKGDSVASAILRARGAGYHALVAQPSGADDEATRFALQLGATVIETDVDASETRELLVEAARNYGFPGLIYVDDLSMPIDIERSVARLHHVSGYAVAAEYERESIDGPRIVVGIPAYEEALSIGSLVLTARLKADEVVVVDDGSRDATAAVAEEAGATVVRHEENRGKGAAIRSLLDHVRDEEFEALVLLDGDGQHTTEDISTVVQPVLDGEADLAIGSRYMEGGNGNETPRYRRFGQRVLDVLTMGSAGLKVSDSQSGFRALSPRAVEELRLRSNGFEVESEMIDVAAREGLEITEEPIEVRYDGLDGSSSNPFRHGLAVVTFILQLVRDRHPLVFFGLPGVFITTIGVMYGIDGILIYQNQGVFYPAKALVAGFLTIIGVMGIFIGLVLNSIANRLDGITQ